MRSTTSYFNLCVIKYINNKYNTSFIRTDISSMVIGINSITVRINKEKYIINTIDMISNSRRRK